MIGRPPVPLEERFWPKVDRRGPDECWRWLACIDACGYGRFQIGTKHDDRAHRVAYRLLVGEIPEGLTLDHLCRNTWCVNPAHLEPVTRAVNSARIPRSRPTHCIHGHELTPENTYVDSLGKRKCRACRRRRSRESNWRRRGKVAT